MTCVTARILVQNVASAAKHRREPSAPRHAEAGAKELPGVEKTKKSGGRRSARTSPESTWHCAAVS